MKRRVSLGIALAVLALAGAGAAEASCICSCWNEEAGWMCDGRCTPEDYVSCCCACHRLHPPVPGGGADPLPECTGSVTELDPLPPWLAPPVDSAPACTAQAATLATTG